MIKLMAGIGTMQMTTDQLNVKIKGKEHIIKELNIKMKRALSLILIVTTMLLSTGCECRFTNSRYGRIY